MPSLLSLHYRRKPSTLRAFVFTVGRKLPFECTPSIVLDEYHENGFTITSGNSLTKMDLLIQWMASNYTLRHHFLTWWKTFRQSLDRKLQRISGKGVNMSIKVPFLHSHLNKFLDDCGYVSDEQGEWFHQDIKTIGEQY